MVKSAGSEIQFRLCYDGVGPVYWSGEPDHFGLQDKSGVLHQGRTGPDGLVWFDFSLAVKPAGADAPVFVGDFAHGPPAGRFLYLGWRNAQGAFAIRLKIPLSPIGWGDVRKALETGEPLVGAVVDKNPKVTTTGANIGGRRAVTWTVGTPS